MDLVPRWYLAGDFEERAKEFAAACYARQARVEAANGGGTWLLDIVRRDTLGHTRSSLLASPGCLPIEQAS